MDMCGDCRYFCKKRFSEAFCERYGKVTSPLAQRDCFSRKQNGVEHKLIKPKRKEMENNTNIALKRCKECGRELPMSSYRPNPRSKDGHLGICYDCLNKKVKEGWQKDKTKDAEPPKLPEPEQAKVHDPFEAHLNKLEILMETSDQELVDELRERGYSVICTKTIEL